MCVVPHAGWHAAVRPTWMGQVVGGGFPQADQPRKAYSESLAELRPVDVASDPARSPEKRRAEIARALDDDERLADVLEEMAEHDAYRSSAKLESERRGCPRGDGP